MKIVRIAAQAESRRREQPIIDALQVLDTHGVCRVTVETDEGITGTSAISFGRLDGAPAVLAHLVNEVLAPAVIGDGPVRHASEGSRHPRRRRLRRHPRHLGAVGSARHARPRQGHRHEERTAQRH